MLQRRASKVYTIHLVIQLLVLIGGPSLAVAYLRSSSGAVAVNIVPNRSFDIPVPIVPRTSENRAILSTCWWCDPAASTNFSKDFASHNRLTEVQDNDGGKLLETNSPIVRELPGGQMHIYYLQLKAQQYIRLIVDQRGIDVEVTLFSPSGTQLSKVDNPNGKNGPEPLAAISEQDGRFRLEIRSLQSADRPGKYQVTLDSIALATPTHRDKLRFSLAAQKAVNEGLDLAGQQRPESLKEAIVKYEEALSYWRKSGDRLGEAIVLDLLGYLHSSLGNERKVIEYFQQSLQTWRSEHYSYLEENALHNIGNSYYLLGQRREALNYFNLALPIEQSIDDFNGQLATLSGLGLVYESLGENQKAVEYANQAVTLLSKIEDPEDPFVAGYTFNNAGVAYWSSGDNQTAIRYFNRALEIFGDKADQYWKATTLNNLSRAYAAEGNNEKALDYLQKILPIVTSKEFDNASVKALTFTGLGATYDRLEDYPNAIKYLSLALPQWDKARDRNGKASALNNIGYAYYYSGKKRQGINYYRQALRLSRSVPYVQGQSLALLNLGRAFEDAGRPKAALSFYKQAIDIREQLRTAARIEAFRINFAARSSEFYTAAISLLSRLKRFPEAFNLSERARARTLLDQVGTARIDIRHGLGASSTQTERDLLIDLADLERRVAKEKAKPAPELNVREIQSLLSQLAAKQREYEQWLTSIKVSNPEYASLSSVAPLDLPKVQQLLDSNTTLLSYFVTPNKTLAFIVTRDSFRTVELTVKEEELNKAVNWFRSFATLNDATPQSLTLLYRRLVAPLRSHLKTSTVGIIPNGVLHYLPFAALFDGSHYFGDHISLYYLPSASILPFVLEKRKPVGTRLLALAQSQGDALPTLRRVDDEVNAIAKLYGTNALTGVKATKTTLFARASGADILHLAAHADLNPNNSLFSRIFLAHAQTDDGLVTVREVYNLILAQTSLVVLSACETHLGVRSKGDDIIGLNRAFIYAGTPTVVASLWTVDDESTEYLMTSFYSHIRQGMSKAESLQAAQRDTRNQYAHPFFWAGFILTGDPGEQTR